MNNARLATIEALRRNFEGEHLLQDSKGRTRGAQDSLRVQPALMRRTRRPAFKDFARVESITREGQRRWAVEGNTHV